MNNIWVILKRELLSFFSTPIAYVFMVVFLLLSGVFTFYFGNFFGRGQADLVPFFTFHPWLYTLFVPAIAMGTWAQERRSGSIELLFTLPMSTWQIIVGKFLAGYVFIALTLSMTFPMWLVVNYLGKPDNGVILASYLGSLLMAGGFLALGTTISALTKNQVIAFVLGVLVCLMFNLMGFPILIEQARSWMPGVLIDVVQGFSFLTNFDTISRGLVDLRSVIYFVSLTVFCLLLNEVVIEAKRAD
jgi:ABC-2 type transport system permease protein